MKSIALVSLIACLSVQAVAQDSTVRHIPPEVFRRQADFGLGCSDSGKFGLISFHPGENLPDLKFGEALASKKPLFENGLIAEVSVNDSAKTVTVVITGIAEGREAKLVLLNEGGKVFHATLEPSGEQAETFACTVIPPAASNRPAQ